MSPFPTYANKITYLSPKVFRTSVSNKKKRSIDPISDDIQNVVMTDSR